MNISIDTTPLHEIQADLLAVAVTENNRNEVLSALDSAFDGQLLSTLDNDDFKPKAGSSTSYATFGAIAASKLVVIGMGKGDASGIQQAAGKAGSLARSAGATSVALAMGDLNDAQTQIAIEGFVAGTYRFDKYKPSDARKDDVANLTLLGTASAAGARALSTGSASDAVDLSEYLVAHQRWQAAEESLRRQLKDGMSPLLR